MNHYIVHIYREMRLTSGAIEAETPEAAAAIARDMPTSDADDITDCEGESFAALVDRAGEGDYANSRMIDFADERLHGATPDLLALSKQVVSARQAGESVADDLYLTAVLMLATLDAVPAGGAMQPYSVLLLYSDYAIDSDTEVFYAFVEASDPLTAVAVAQRQAMAALEDVASQPDDFVPLLVTRGHHHSEPLFNK